MRGGSLLIAILLFIFLILAVLRVKSIPDNPDPDPEVLHDSEDLPTNPPLAPATTHDAAIVVAPDGTVYFVEIGSGKIRWSFSSGPSIYSSYQTLPSKEGENLDSSADSDNFYIDIGDDWKLYLHAEGFNKVQLNLSAEEFVRRTPFVSIGGGVMLGSKTTAVFLVDVKTGKLVRTFKFDNSSVGEQEANESSILARTDIKEWEGSSPTDLEDVEKPLYVTRTDYDLRYTSKKTGNVLWYLKFADVEALFQHEERTEDLLGGILREDYKFGQGYKLHQKLTMPYQTSPVVYRIRDRASLQSLFMVDKLPVALPRSIELALPAAQNDTMLKQLDKFLGVRHDGETEMVLALPKPNTDKLTIRSLPGSGGHHMSNNIDSHNLEHSHFWPSILYTALVPLVMAFLFYVRRVVAKGEGKLHTQPEDNKFQVIKAKKKRRSRNATKNSNFVRNKMINSQDHQNVQNDIQNNELSKVNFSPNYSSNYNGLVNGRHIGKLLVSDKEIAKGSNGTIVLEGIYDGRLVAVKRLVQTHHDVALKEIQNLIASDHHPNIVRWHGVEYDQDFVYLALERCTCSLHDLISYYTPSEDQTRAGDQDNDSLSDYSIRLKCVLGNEKDLELWKANGYPSPCLLKLMREIVCGLAHLHELGIIHRDLKPQNVLVLKEKSMYAKLSDMGISKRLTGSMSLTKNSTGYGSSGWQAPEQLRHERQTRAIDLFSLGCIFFFCMTGGKHPFGESLVRDINIINNQKDLFLIEHIPEATELISRLLDPNPDLRPKSIEVMQHPLFWDSETRLSFLRDASDRVELEDRENESEILKALESIGKVALGGKWDEKMDDAFIHDIGRYRRYKFDSVRDLLRVIRNKLNHFRELSKEIQELIGPVPHGFDSYFSSRFPKLLIEVYRVTHTYCAEEETFHKYFRSN